MDNVKNITFIVFVNALTIFLLLTSVSAQISIQEARFDFCDFESDLCGFVSNDCGSTCAPDPLTLSSETECQTNFDRNSNDKAVGGIDTFTAGIDTEGKCMLMETLSSSFIEIEAEKTYVLSSENLTRSNDGVFLWSFIFFSDDDTDAAANTVSANIQAFNDDTSTWENATNCYYQQGVSTDYGTWVRCWLDDNSAYTQLRIRMRNRDRDENNVGGNMWVDRVEMFYLTASSTGDTGDTGDTGNTGIIDLSAIVNLLPLIIIMRVFSSLGNIGI